MNLKAIVGRVVPTIHSKLLLAMMVVSLVPIFIFGAVVYYQARDSLINQVGERLQAASHLAISQLERSFSFSAENVQSWAQLEIMQQIAEGDPNGTVSDMLGDYQRSWGYYSNLVVADIHGRIVAAGDRDLLGVDVADAEWFRNTLQKREKNLGRLRLDPAVGGYGVAISVPIFRRNTSDMIGVLSAGFSWTELLSMVNSIEVVSGGQNESGYALLIDRDGYIIAAPNFILLQDAGSSDSGDILRVYGRRWWPMEDPELLKQMLNVSGHRYVERGDEHLLVVNQPSKKYDTLSELGWSLLLVRDADDALSDLAVVRERALVIALLSCLVIFVASSLIARRVAQPVLALREWAKQVARGDLNRKVDIEAHDEVGDLAASLDDMRLDIKGYLDELYDAKERFQSLINSIDCIVWEADVNPIRIKMVNGQTEHVLGRSNNDLLDEMQVWRNWVHEDHVDRVARIFRNAVETARDNYVEFKARHSDGHYVWLKALLSVEIEDGNVVGLRGVMVDINDIVRAAEEMKEAHDIAVKTAESKSRFLAIVSHEIRTPMNGLLGMLEMLRDTPLDDEQHQQLDLAWKSGRNLLALVNDVMDFSRLESGEVEFHPEEITVQTLLNEQVALVAPEAYQKGLDVGVVVEANLPEKVTLDAVKVRQVLAALLSNAVKFTSHGSVLLWAEMLSADRLYVEVKDTGVGIANEQQEGIFQPFVQEDLSSTRRFDGSGLGLALCRRIIEAMGGSVGVKSIKGVGSSFYFELPVISETVHGTSLLEERKQLKKARGNARTPGAVLLIGDLPATKTVLQIACQQWGLGFDWHAKETRVIRDLDAIMSRKDYQWLFIAQEMSERFWSRMNPYLAHHGGVRVVQLRQPNEKYGQRPLPHLYVPCSREDLLKSMLGAEPMAEKDASRERLTPANLPRVLVVDDNPVNRKVAAGFLKKLGFETDVAEDGLQAVRAVENSHYGLVLMDCQMPVMDGYEATRQIRSHLRGRFLPIIAVTANAMEGDRDKCLAAGMDDYMAKPLRKDALNQMVFSWLEKAREQSS
ncbi:MAG: response regulator [Ketobacteraceae bacterium]|nr:response regulator [Ketobacteraceae bacterium]